MDAAVLGAFAALLAGAGAVTLYAAVTTAPFVRTPRAAVRAALRLAQLRPNETLVDLGCGNGRVLTIAAREFKAIATGWELAPHHALIAWIAAKFRGRGRVAVRWGNCFDAELSGADVIYFWLTPRAFWRLIPKLAAEARPGARVVTYSVPIPGWKPLRTATPPGCRYRVFCYAVPPR